MSSLSTATTAPGPVTAKVTWLAAAGTTTPCSSTTKAVTCTTSSHVGARCVRSAMSTTAAALPAVRNSSRAAPFSHTAWSVPASQVTRQLRGEASAASGLLPSDFPFSSSSTPAQLLYTSTFSSCAAALGGVQSSYSVCTLRRYASYPGSVGGTSRAGTSRGRWTRALSR